MLENVPMGKKDDINVQKIVALLSLILMSELDYY